MTLADYIATHLSTPFKWGEHDCVLFAARWVQASTGRDPLAGLPHWDSKRTAAQVIAFVGGLVVALDERFVRVQPNFARDGDLVLREGAVCIVSGPHLVGAGPAGLNFIDRTEAQFAWSVKT